MSTPNQVYAAITVSLESVPGPQPFAAMRVELYSEVPGVLEAMRANPDGISKVLREAADAVDAQTVDVPPPVVWDGSWTNPPLADPGQGGMFL